MSETICGTCSYPIYRGIDHVCPEFFPGALIDCEGDPRYAVPPEYIQKLRLRPSPAEEIIYTQNQCDERLRAALRDLIDERDSLLDDLDATLDEVDELRADLEAVCGDLKLVTEREEARKELEKAAPILKKFLEIPAVRAALDQEGARINFVEILEGAGWRAYFDLFEDVEPEFVGGPGLYEYKIINRFSVRGREYVVTLNGHVYQIVEPGGSACSPMYLLVAYL